MAYEYTENLTSTPRSDIPGKASGKRKKHPFSLKNRKRYSPPLFIPKTQLPKKYQSSTYADVADPYRRMALEDNPVMKATTARNNDGMSFVW